MFTSTHGGRLRPIALSAVVLSAVLAAACATTESGDTDRPEADGSCSETGEISIGNACFTPKDTGRIAFLSGGAKVFSFSTTSGKGVKEAAAKADIEVDEFYANGDVATMMTQVRQVLTSGKYGGVVFAPVNGQACSVLADLAAENEVLVVAISNTLCGQDAVGEENWSEGTLQYVGGANIQEGYQSCLESAAAIAPGPQKVLQVHGPVDNGVTKLTEKAVTTFTEENPDWTVASPVYTDFTTPSAFNAVQNALQGSKSSDVSLILTDYVDIAAGAAYVLTGANGSGKSTFARRHFLPTEVLSSDFFRALVADDETDQSATGDAFEALHFVARKRLWAGRLTVVDATSTQSASRKPLVALAREAHVIPVAIVLNVPERVCQARNRERTDRQVPPHAIASQVQQLRRSLRELRRDGVAVPLSPKAFRLLEMLIEARPKPVCLVSGTASAVDSPRLIPSPPTWNSVGHSTRSMRSMGSVSIISATRTP